MMGNLWICIRVHEKHALDFSFTVGKEGRSDPSVSNNKSFFIFCAIPLIQLVYRN